MSANAQERRIEAPESLEDVLEDLITVKEAAKLLRRHVASVYRACLKGSGPNRRKLRFVMRGRESCTTRVWIAEYLEGLTRDRLDRTGGNAPAPTFRAPSRRSRDLARVDRELESLGV